MKLLDEPEQTAALILRKADVSRNPPRSAAKNKRCNIVSLASLQLFDSHRQSVLDAERHDYR